MSDKQGYILSYVFYYLGLHHEYCRLRPIPMIWYNYFQYGNKGGGVKRGKKFDNVDEVVIKHSFIVHR